LCRWKSPIQRARECGEVERNLVDLDYSRRVGTATIEQAATGIEQVAAAARRWRGKDAAVYRSGCGTREQGQIRHQGGGRHSEKESVRGRSLVEAGRGSGVAHAAILPHGLLTKVGST
jgi:hypothetical protein